MLQTIFSAGISLIALGLFLGSVYDWRWPWRFGRWQRFLQGRLGITTTRLGLGLLGGLILYLQVRQAANAFFASVIGQIFFIGLAGVLLGLALHHRNKRS